MPYDIIIGRDEADKKRFGKKGLAFIGKTYVTMGNSVSMSNNLFLDIARNHVILITGKRGAGKSYSISVIAEELSLLPEEERNNLAGLMFDTLGVFWTMKYKNEKDSELLAQWGEKPKELPIIVSIPFGLAKEYEKNSIQFDNTFAVSPAEMDAEDWMLAFKLNITDQVSLLIQKIISLLKKTSASFEITDIISEIKNDNASSEEAKKLVLSLFQAAETWGIFSSKNSTPIKNLVTPGKTTILDISRYSSTSVFNVRALLIGLLSKKLFSERMKLRKAEEVAEIKKDISYTKQNSKEMPIIWLFIDEVHEFIPKGEKTSASNILSQILREGRQPGISIVMATQQPASLSPEAISQSDIVISHRLTALSDMQALNEMMQSYNVESLKSQFDSLPHKKGSAIILDDNSERIYPAQIRPKFTWHGGESPSAVETDK